MEPLVKLNNVGKKFFSDNGEIEVLKDISFSIYENEIVAILGPSGCGKSTILNLLSELEKPTEGTIDKQVKFGYMFQKDHLMEWRSIFQNVILGLEISRKKTKENLKYANDLLNKYHLSDFKNYYPRELSGGMRQRVSLIRTLVLRPDVLLLDEPFSALDFQTKMMVQDDVFQIIKNEKKSAIIVTHDISEAIALSNRILVLTERPCTIKKEFIIDFPIDKCPTQRRSNLKFNEYFNQIYESLNN